MKIYSAPVMSKSNRTLALAFLMPVIVIVYSISASADPCLVVYPQVSCVYHYDETEYYTVSPGHSLYDPEYDRGGEVLIEVGTNEIDMSIYQAPNLTGFEASTDGIEGFAFISNQFNVIIDGFSNSPTVFSNVYLVFDDVVPESCLYQIQVNGQPLVGNKFPLGDLVVSTPTEEGNNYSDVISAEVSWSGCYSVSIWSYADENYNGVHDGPECFSAFSHDAILDAEDASWGKVKSIFK